MADKGLPPPGPSLLELKTIYEGPGGRSAARFLKKTTLIVTNRTVEIEREGANVCMTVLTMGCWYMFFQTASIEIYELRDSVIIGVIPGKRCGGRCGGGKFEIDLPRDSPVSIKDLFMELKASWESARREALMGDDDLGWSEESDFSGDSMSDEDMLMAEEGLDHHRDDRMEKQV
eukprot:g3839.t1